MKYTSKFLMQLAVVVVATGLLAAPALGKSNAALTVTATPAAQTQDMGINGEQVAVNMFYAYGPLPANSSVVDHIPVQLCAASTLGVDKDGNPISPYPSTVAFRPHGQGGNLPGVSMPADTVISADGCTNVTIGISTGALAPGAYNMNIDILVTVSPQNTTAKVDNVQNIHIQVLISDGTSNISCFITDSSFVYLTNCAGGFVTSGSGGRFLINTNSRKIEVATNPGQFYYNVLWTNTTGSDQTVSISFGRTGVRPQGAQAIHAKTFPSYPGVTYAEFEQVNDAIPGGNNDLIQNVVVKAGWTLWVDYHLEWNGLGATAPDGATNTCALANQAFSVTATVSNASVTAQCTAGASGYLKK